LSQSPFIIDGQWQGGIGSLGNLQQISAKFTKSTELEIKTRKKEIFIKRGRGGERKRRIETRRDGGNGEKSKCEETKGETEVHGGGSKVVRWGAIV
jgi:hypothetical protein